MNANQLANASSKTTHSSSSGLMVVAFLLVPDQAHAGTGGTAFDDVWVTLRIGPKVLWVESLRVR
ncbi:hypothetical protein BANRA_05244 [Klebsiella pneumoniae]|nr:hypothetical protein BANRA_05244 [Klebsiella pneumoniae]